MLVNRARTVSEALSQGLHAIRIHGIAKPSRVGDVLVMPRPVMTEYEDPTNRVLFSPMRDANPFFHVMETLWMLSGRNDLPWLVRFNKRFSSYSDDGGKTQPGAYGYRWRNYFGHDQLADVILELKQNPDSRRVVLAMWDGGSRHSWQFPDYKERFEQQPGDFYAALSGSNDVPCNTHAYFDTIDGRLNMTVCCRSNDIIWGAYGANAVHFSFLLEFIAASTGIPMGVYRQFSNNFHLYTNIVPQENIMAMSRNVLETDRYLMKEGQHVNKILAEPPLRKISLMQRGLEIFEEDLAGFMEWTPGCSVLYREPFFEFVAQPMYLAHERYRAKDYDGAISIALDIKAQDWQIACVEWLQRKKVRYEQNQHRFTEVAEPTQQLTENNAFGMEERSSD